MVLFVDLVNCFWKIQVEISAYHIDCSTFTQLLIHLSTSQELKKFVMLDLFWCIQAGYCYHATFRQVLRHLIPDRPLHYLAHCAICMPD